MAATDVSPDGSAQRAPRPSASRQTVGRIEILISAIGYGFVGIFGKLAFAAGFSAGEMLTLRFGLASVILWIYVLAARRSALETSWPNVAICAMLGAFGYALFTMMYFTALKGLSASLTALLLYTYPVIVTVGARVMFGDHVHAARWVALPIVAVGLVMLLWGDMAVTAWSSVFFGLGSALFYSVYILVSSRALRSIDMLIAGTYITTSAAIAFFCYTPLTIGRIASLSLAAWGAVGGLALVATVGPLVLFLKGLEKTSSAEASMLSLLEPMTATVAAALLLGDRFTMLQMTGAVVILAALIWAAVRSRYEAPRNSDQSTTDAVSR